MQLIPRTLSDRRRAAAVAACCALLAAGPAGAGGDEAIWTNSFEHPDGLKITLASSSEVGSPTSAIRACFVLSNTNSPPGGVLGVPSGVRATISASDTAGGALPFRFGAPTVEDTGGIDVACSVVGGGTGGRLVPIAPGAVVGVIPAAHVTNKCCFAIFAPPLPAPPPAGFFAAASATCDPSYSECYPGEGDELLYVLQSDSGSQQSTETIHLWSLGGPGCGLVGIEAIAVLVAARRLRVHTGGRRRVSS